MPDPTPNLPAILRRCAELRDWATDQDFDEIARRDAAMRLAYEVGPMFEAVRTFYAVGLKAIDDLERLEADFKAVNDQRLEMVERELQREFAPAATPSPRMSGAPPWCRAIHQSACVLCHGKEACEAWRRENVTK